MNYEGHLTPHPEVKLRASTYELEHICLALVIAMDAEPNSDNVTTWKRVHRETLAILDRVKAP